MRNLFPRIDISLYASVGIISKHSLHILAISQNKRHIHSQHCSPKLCCGMSPLGIFSWNCGIYVYEWLSFVEYFIVLYANWFDSCPSVLNTEGRGLMNTFYHFQTKKWNKLKNQPYQWKLQIVQNAKSCMIGWVWPKSGNVCLYLPNRLVGKQSKYLQEPPRLKTCITWT